MSPEERYSWIKRGCWRIILIRGKGAQAQDEPSHDSPSQESAELVEALKTRGVTAKTAAELVATHPPNRIQTKLEVFDWLLRNEDKRVDKNPAGYLVASIRSDYQAPGNFQTAAAEAKAAETKRAAEEAKRRDQKRTRDEAKTDEARMAELRAAWERLPDAERDAILAAVKAENPGLSRWKKMLEPLCLAALEARLNSSKGAQKTLFPET